MAVSPEHSTLGPEITGFTTNITLFCDSVIRLILSPEVMPDQDLVLGRVLSVKAVLLELPGNGHPALFILP